MPPAGGLTWRLLSVIYTAWNKSSKLAAPAHGTTAIDRGADLLLRVLESEQPVALTDLASAAGLPKSTASRLVSALERRGLIEQDGERGRLRPGPAILRVAERSMLERSLVEMSRSALDVLAEATGETINLSVPGPDGVEHIAQVDSRHFLGPASGSGARWATSIPPTARCLRRSVARPPGAAGATANGDLQAVRRDDFATSIDELEIGLSAIAAPVRGARSEVIAALSISGPTLRMPPERIAELRTTLTSEARTLSRRLGHREQGERAA